jgi:drug/metabolite transporter (DMT)-like permease
MAVNAALWGSSYMFIEIALDDLSPAFLVWARVVLGALVLGPVAVRLGAVAAARRHLGWLSLIAVVQVVAPFVLIAVGQQSIPSSLAGILVASAPIFTSLFAGAMLPGDRLGPRGIAGIGVGIVGVMLLFGVDLGSDGPDAVVGGLLVLVASMGYAVGSLVAKRRLEDVQPVGVAAGIMALSGLMLLPVAPFVAPDAVGLDTAGALVALGAGGTGLAFLIFYTLNAEIGPSRASIVAYIAPGFSVLYGVTLLGEGFTVATAAGLVLILGGSWLAASSTSAEATHDAPPPVAPDDLARERVPV